MLRNYTFLSNTQKGSHPSRSNQRLSLLSKVIHLTLCFGFLIISIVYVWDTLAYAPLNTDAGYYLPLSQRIAWGTTPFREINTSYTPLAFYYFASAYLTSNEPSYVSFVVVLMSFHLLTALLTYRILLSLSGSIFFGIFAALVQLSSLALHEGSYIFLEPFIATFSLLALCFYLSDKRRNLHLFLAGFCSLLAFLSKQYGLGMFAALCVSIILQKNKEVRHKTYELLFLSFGMVIPFLLITTAFCLLYGLTPSDIQTTLYPSGYWKEFADPEAIIDFLLYSHTFLPLALWIVLRHAPVPLEKVFPLVLALIFFSSTLLIRTFLHYFQLIIPFSVILGVYALFLLSQRHKKLGILYAVLFLPLAYNGLTRPLWSITYPHLRSELNEGLLAKRLHHFWPAWSRVIVLSDPMYYYSLSYFPSDDKKPGYAFLSNFSTEDLNRFFSSADKILVDLHSDYFHAEKRKIEAMYGEWEQYLHSLRFERTHILDEKFELWEKPDSAR